MKLALQQTRKANQDLREALGRADPRSEMRVVMFLEPQEIASDARPEIDPSSFSSRTEYRKALIERRAQLLRHGNASTLESLHALSIDTDEAQPLSAVVARGSAEAIVQALSIPGVRKVALDTPLDPELSGQSDPRSD